MKNITPSVFTFEELIKNNFLYVDKTEFLWNLITQGKGMYFFSRPRRFGKSLTISTLKAIFQGKKELFLGTALYSKEYDWQDFPIIHLDMGSCAARNKDDLEQFLLKQIYILANENNVDFKENYTSCSIAFCDLILALSQNNKKVVILLDEYDKPILNNILEPQAKEILEVLKGFYSVIKTCEPHERFVFITGVSKFSHVSIFSNLNNLLDITMDKKYALMTGYTQEELEQNFAEHITVTAKEKNMSEQELLEKMKYWYNGYRFHGKTQTVYNPSSIAQFFASSGDFNNYWFSTGTPTFLLTAMKNQNFDLEDIFTRTVSQLAFSAYEIDRIDPLLLLIQTGYVTIKSSEIEFEETVYSLDFPNYEVKSSFETYLLNSYAGISSEHANSFVRKLSTLVGKGDVDAFMSLLQSFFAGIPYDLHVKHEKYYQTIFFVLFRLIGLNIEAESRTNNGRIDAVCHYNNHVFIFEFKLNSNAEIALEQIKEKEYWKKYEHMTDKTIHLVGSNFSFETGQIEEWLVD